MHHLLDPSSTALDEWLAARGEPKYRVGQIRQWAFQKRADAFDDMTSLPKPLREALAAEFTMWTTTVARHQQDPDGTEKLLFTLADREQIESVLLRDGIRRTICISTQVGCAMGCVFCASGLNGVERNLTTGEIVEQMLRLARLLPDDERLSHIVVMGMGEPLANIENLIPALDMASSDDGLAISARRITISTVGLPPAIERLARDKIPYHLAVSLHAADDELRNRLVKVNRNIGLAAILAAADQYFAATGRRITFEYVMLAGENDGREHAAALAKRLAGRNALVNLIPYNPVAGLPYGTPSRNAVYRFASILTDAGINAQIRERKGSRIDAACGQLRRTEQQVIQLSPSK